MVSTLWRRFSVVVSWNRATLSTRQVTKSIPFVNWMLFTWLGTPECESAKPSAILRSLIATDCRAFRPREQDNKSTALEPRRDSSPVKPSQK